VGALVDAIYAHDRVVGFCVKLDYAPDIIARTDVDTQLRRLKATCDASLQEDVPIQISVGNDEASQVQVAKDITKVLLGVIPEDDEMPLQVHLSCWSGTSDSMLKLLKAFPDTLYIGMNPTVSFAKATTAHACAFDVPLDRLLLETDPIIPAPTTKSLGRKAFAHSGLVPYCAAAVAEQKKISSEEVARAASENTIRLYGRGVEKRAKQIIVEAEVRVAQQQNELDAELQEEAVHQAKEQVETKQEQKKKKKTGVEQVSKQEEDVERDFDDDILSSMLKDSEIAL
jgi:Tat protein secretion system quality control protein TatD with DNase activity